MRKISMTVLALFAGALVGCGGGAKIAPNKEAAAEAMYKATGFAADMSVRMQDPIAARAMTALVTYDCTHGGTATYSMDDAASSTEAALQLSYNNCNEDGENEMNGSFTFSFVQTSDTCGDTSCAFAMRLKGKVTFSGEISDFVDFDVVEAFTMTTSGSTATVTLRVDGYIKTSSGTYTYDNEEVVVSGSIDQA